MFDQRALEHFAEQIVEQECALLPNFPPDDVCEFRAVFYAALLLPDIATDAV